MKITDYEKCFGCSACEYICPKKCITMKFDSVGFYYPEIDETLCVECNKCSTVCPANINIRTSDIQKVYKGYIDYIESDENQKSTSGAIFALLANQMLAYNGVVFGVSFDEDFKNVSHIACETVEQINKCRGSKYIQSQTQGIYKQVKNQLEWGKKVLFSGTPCQIAALYSCLGEHPENLITVDFVCHGVGSTAFYQAFLSNVTNDQGVCYVGFRDKLGCYIKSKFIVLDNNRQQVYNVDSYKDGFGKAFANNLISRLSCGTCKFASTQRVSDISLADNVMFATEKEKIYGSSLVFINTKKGFEFFESVKSEAVIEELEREAVIPKIMHLNHPATPHKDRRVFLDTFKDEGYIAAYKYILPYQPQLSFKKRLNKKIKRVLENVFKNR